MEKRCSPGKNIGLSNNSWFLIHETPTKLFSRVLKNVFEAASARRKLSKKRSLHPVNEHFETIFNAAIATQIVFQQPASGVSLGVPIAQVAREVKGYGRI